MFERLAVCFIGSFIACAFALVVAQGFTAAVNAPFEAMQTGKEALRGTP